MDYWVVGDLHQALQNMDLEALDYVLREEGGPGLRSGDLGVGCGAPFHETGNMPFPRGITIAGEYSCSGSSNRGAAAELDQLHPAGDYSKKPSKISFRALRGSFWQFWQFWQFFT